MKHKAFTLFELLIVIAVFTVLAVTSIVLLNPLAMVNKANDTTRRKQLEDTKKILEQYLADTGCYPVPTQICAKNTTLGSCTFCANGTPPQFSYFEKNTCDPKRTSDYVYEISSKTIKGITTIDNCPKWYRIYSVLDAPYNETLDTWGCRDGGCGISPNYGYDYLITSPGAPIDNSITTNFYCHTNSDACAQCTPYSDCITPGLECFGKTIYPSRGLCCSLYPSAQYCH